MLAVLAAVLAVAAGRWPSLVAAVAVCGRLWGAALRVTCPRSSVSRCGVWWAAGAALTPSLPPRGEGGIDATGLWYHTRPDVRLCATAHISARDSAHDSARSAAGCRAGGADRPQTGLVSLLCVFFAPGG